MRGSSVRWTAAGDPVRDPMHHLLHPDTRAAEHAVATLSVAKESVGRFLPLKRHFLVKEPAEILCDPADAEQFGAGDIHDERRARDVVEGLQSDSVRVGLPECVEITHRQIDWYP